MGRKIRIKTHFSRQFSRKVPCLACLTLRSSNRAYVCECSRLLKPTQLRGFFFAQSNSRSQKGELGSRNSRASYGTPDVGSEPCTEQGTANRSIGIILRLQLAEHTQTHTINVHLKFVSVVGLLCRERIFISSWKTFKMLQLTFRLVSYIKCLTYQHFHTVSELENIMTNPNRTSPYFASTSTKWAIH